MATIFFHIFHPFIHEQFGHALFWCLACFPLIYVSFIMPTVRNNSISIGDMFRSLRSVSLEYTVSVTAALISINTCLDRPVSAFFGL